MATIRIADIGTTSIYTLTGDVLAMTSSGGCRDALNDNGCRVNEDMSDGEIESAVYDAWCEGYVGNPDDCGLAVKITRTEE